MDLFSLLLSCFFLDGGYLNPTQFECSTKGVFFLTWGGAWRHSVPEVPRACQHARRQQNQPLRQPRSEGVCGLVCRLYATDWMMRDGQPHNTMAQSPRGRFLH